MIDYSAAIVAEWRARGVTGSHLGPLAVAAVEAVAAAQGAPLRAYRAGEKHMVKCSQGCGHDIEVPLTCDRAGHTTCPS